MARVVMINGSLRSEGEQVVSVFDRGFLYGDSVFETVRTYGGQPFALTLHLQRLQRSAQQVFIAVPISIEELEREVRAAVAAANNSESYIRIMLTRGEGRLGLDPSLAENPARVVIVSPLQKPDPKLYEGGISVASFRTQRATDATSAAGSKVGNYLVSVLATKHALAQGASEALIVDASGGVVEGATSNLFLVIGNQILTPPVDAGILAGITRKYILDLAPSVGLTLKFSVPTLDKVLAAQEVFITSSIRELMPVTHVDNHTIGTGEPGAVSLKLLQSFRNHVGSPSSPGRIVEG